MELYEKIKEFVAISPAPINLGEYLKDASKVCSVYYDMMGLERIESAKEINKKEDEMNKTMDEILVHWKR